MVQTKKKILLIISGSVAAYKMLDMIRLLKKDGYQITPILTEGAKAFVTPLSVASLSESTVYSDVFSLKDETEMGHIRLSREHDLIVVAPASADILGKMANGLADDLASTVLLATDKPVVVAPAMNHRMWQHKAVQRNVKQLQKDGVEILGPVDGELACGEEGEGRLVDIQTIIQYIQQYASSTCH